MISSPTGIDNKVIKELSLFLITDITPMVNPTTPKTAISGVGNGSLISIAKVDNFNDIKTIKIRVRIAAHFPALHLDQS